MDNFLQKHTTVCQKSVSWHSNQEWRSICADTVDLIKFTENMGFTCHSYFDVPLNFTSLNWHYFQILPVSIVKNGYFHVVNQYLFYTIANLNLQFDV